MSDYLTPETSARGFDRMPPIDGEYGGTVQAYESSAAGGPHVWLKLESEEDGKATLHLTAENAWRLSEQLQKLVREHYQGDATPEWAR